MKTTRLACWVGAVAVSATLLGSFAAADETERAVRFAPPRRIHAGEKFLGAGRLYPSPVLHDVDGDRRADLVVADLFGRVTVALRSADGEHLAFGEEKPLLKRDGKPLKFSNW